MCVKHWSNALPKHVLPTFCRPGPTALNGDCFALNSGASDAGSVRYRDGTASGAGGVSAGSDAAAAVVDEALALPVLPKVIWMQLGVRNDAAATKAEAAGVKVVMNRCPKIEYARLTSEIQWLGVNSRTISSKRAPIPTSNMRLSLNRSSVSGGATTAADRAAKDKNDLP